MSLASQQFLSSWGKHLLPCTSFLLKNGIHYQMNRKESEKGLNARLGGLGWYFLHFTAHGKHVGMVETQC